jgi:hypothetical protein
VNVNNPQQAVDSLLGQFKNQVMMMLNETADEFDARELTDEQKFIYNEFTAAFGQKVLSMRVTVQEMNNGQRNNN